MKYCNNCVMPNTKPGVVLDQDGFCNGCRSHLEKSKINWEKRWDNLKQIISEIKNKKNTSYDCIVAVSGGKDSWYQAYVLAKVFELKVLCVTLGAHLPTTEGIENLNNMIFDLNVDHIKITLKPSIYRGLRKNCFTKIGEPNWAEHCAMFSSVLNTALLYDVPLVIWGEDISFEFGGKQGENSKPSAININENDLVRGEKVSQYANPDASPRDFFFYHYPDQKKLKDANLQSLYLGHFVNWYGRKNFEFAKSRGFVARREGPLPGNYISYDNIDEKLCEINIWLKYLKFGFWRPTDQTCYDIWNGTLSREDAVNIVLELQDEFPDTYLNEFLEFHELTKEEFFKIAEGFRNKDIWNASCEDPKLKNILS